MFVSKYVFSSPLRTKYGGAKPRDYILYVTLSACLYVESFGDDIYKDCIIIMFCLICIKYLWGDIRWPSNSP